MMLAGILASIIIRYSNIDKTSARVFVDYWELNIVIAIVIFIGTILFYREQRKQ